MSTKGSIAEREEFLAFSRGFARAVEEAPEGRTVDLLFRFLGETIGCDRVYLFERTPEGNYSNTYEWCREGVEPEKDRLQDVPAKICRPWYEIYRRGSVVMIRDLEEIRLTDPQMYEILLPQNIQRLITGQLCAHGRDIGFFGLDNPPAQEMDRIAAICQLLGYFIAETLQERDLVSRLEQIGLADRLTGVGNRYALQQYLQTIPEKDSVGVIFADMTGLKRINDLYGHMAGDEYLSRFARLLTEHFGRERVYRFGGDEFLVIVSGREREEIERELGLAEGQMQEQELLASCGLAWESPRVSAWEDLIAAADQQMYEKKRAWYAEHPGLCRDPEVLRDDFAAGELQVPRDVPQELIEARELREQE